MGNGNIKITDMAKSWIILVIAYITTARRTSLLAFLFKLTFLSLGSLFVLHISGKRSLTVTLLPCKS